MAVLSRFNGIFDASAYAYGVNSTAPAGLLVLSGSTGTGAYTLTCQPQKSVNPNLASCVPTTTTPITVGQGSNAETVTPSAVSTDMLGNILITATFSNSHLPGDMVRSGTMGLQEALNAASSYGGGLVAVDAGWVALGGTQAILIAAAVPPKVGLVDNRFGSGYSAYTATLTSTQILNLATTSVELLPAPNAGAFWQVNSATLVKSAGTAYTAGSALEIGWGSTVPTNALSGTVASTFLTGSTAIQTIQVGSTTSNLAGSVVNGLGVYINNATTAFATGTGTVQVTLLAALIQG